MPGTILRVTGLQQEKLNDTLSYKGTPFSLCIHLLNRLIPYILAVENKRIINMRHANVSDILIPFTFLKNGVERAEVDR